MTSRVDIKDGFCIAVGCPGCGGRLNLQTDFFVTECEHCGSPLRIIMPESPPAFIVHSALTDLQLRSHIDRHLKRSELPLTNAPLQIKRLYYPYWKIDGTLLKLRNRTEVRKFYSENDSTVESVIETDRSTVSSAPYSHTLTAGEPIVGIPVSLGLRSETVPALPFAEDQVEECFDICPVTIAKESASKTAHQAVRALSTISPADFGTNLTRLFNTTFSLIYFPYFTVECYDNQYRRFFVDGLVGRVLAVLNPGETDWDVASDDILEPENPPKTQIEFGALEVDFHRCNVCGCDLPTIQSHIYICANCHELQACGKETPGLTVIEQVLSETDEPVRMVPFWRLHLPAIMSGQIGHLLGGLDRSECLLIPALGSSNIEAIHKLARRMSAAHGRMPTVAVEQMDDRFLPVATGLSEACALAEMIICRELIDHGQNAPDVLEITPISYGLVYVPFHLENYFYVDSALQVVSLERTLID